MTAKLGTIENPCTVAPEGWSEKGWGDMLPPDGYVACKCAGCGLVAYSTIMFDFYADGAGAPLKCERCALSVPWTNEAVKQFQDALIADIESGERSHG